MDGYVGEACLYGIHGKVTEEDERRLFGSQGETLGTVVAVATDPSRVDKTSQESYPELGVPEEILEEFMEVRDSLDIADHVKRHNTAVKRVDLKTRYKEYLDENEEARQQMHALAERVADGEEITLICVEERPMWCHRYHLRDRIKELAKEMAD